MAQKPKIDDVIGNLLAGENLNRALEFINYLKNNKISIQWTNTCTWKAVKKGVAVCYIKAGILHGSSIHTKFLDDRPSAGSLFIQFAHGCIDR